MLNSAHILDLEIRLLIVDDDRGIRELTATFLSAQGYVVDTAADGASMRTALARERYVLVVLDVMMSARFPARPFVRGQRLAFRSRDRRAG